MYKVYVDPGHGTNVDGIDYGATGPNGERESVVVLAVGKYLRTALIRNGFDVKMSRYTELTTKILSQRVKEANNWGADIVVSIHANAFSDPQAHGSETIVYRKGARAEQLAKKILYFMLKEVPLYDRGVKEGNFAIIRDTDAPATLCELAFISNPTECKMLTDPAYQKKWAEAICMGICDYFQVSYKKEVIPVADPYKDWNKVPDWAKESVLVMKNAGIMTGTGNGKFEPNRSVTRAELAVALNNLLNYLKK